MIELWNNFEVPNLCVTVPLKARGTEKNTLY